MSEVRARAEVSWSGWGGDVRGGSGHLVASTATQVELGGPGGGTNPEELLAATLANCVTSELTALARSRGLNLDEIRSRAATTLGQLDEHHRVTAAELDITVTTSSDEQSVRNLILEAADQCPVCVALRATMPVSVRVTVTPTGTGYGAGEDHQFGRS